MSYKATEAVSDDSSDQDILLSIFNNVDPSNVYLGLIVLFLIVIITLCCCCCIQTCLFCKFYKSFDNLSNQIYQLNVSKTIKSHKNKSSKRSTDYKNSSDGDSESSYSRSSRRKHRKRSSKARQQSTSRSSTRSTRSTRSRQGRKSALQVASLSHGRGQSPPTTQALASPNTPHTPASPESAQWPGSVASAISPVESADEGLLRQRNNNNNNNNNKFKHNQYNNHHKVVELMESGEDTDRMERAERIRTVGNNINNINTIGRDRSATQPVTRYVSDIGYLSNMGDSESNNYKFGKDNGNRNTKNNINDQSRNNEVNEIDNTVAESTNNMSRNHRNERTDNREINRDNEDEMGDLPNIASIANVASNTSVTTTSNMDNRGGTKQDSLARTLSDNSGFSGNNNNNNINTNDNGRNGTHSNTESNTGSGLLSGGFGDHGRFGTHMSDIKGLMDLLAAMNAFAINTPDNGINMNGINGINAINAITALNPINDSYVSSDYYNTDNINDKPSENTSINGSGNDTAGETISSHVFDTLGVNTDINAIQKMNDNIKNVSKNRNDLYTDQNMENNMKDIRNNNVNNNNNNNNKHNDHIEHFDQLDIKNQSNNHSNHSNHSDHTQNFKYKPQIPNMVHNDFERKRRDSASSISSQESLPQTIGPNTPSYNNNINSPIRSKQNIKNDLEEAWQQSRELNRPKVVQFDDEFDNKNGSNTTKLTGQRNMKQPNQHDNNNDQTIEQSNNEHIDDQTMEQSVGNILNTFVCKPDIDNNEDVFIFSGEMEADIDNNNRRVVKKYVRRDSLDARAELAKKLKEMKHGYEVRLDFGKRFGETQVEIPPSSVDVTPTPTILSPTSVLGNKSVKSGFNMDAIDEENESIANSQKDDDDNDNDNDNDNYNSLINIEDEPGVPSIPGVPGVPGVSGADVSITVGIDVVSEARDNNNGNGDVEHLREILDIDSAKFNIDKNINLWGGQMNQMNQIVTKRNSKSSTLIMLPDSEDSSLNDGTSENSTFRIRPSEDL